MSGRKNLMAHHHLAQCLNPKTKSVPTERFRKKFIREISDFSNIIVSSESFSNTNNLRLIKEFFRGFEIITIIYFREILDYYGSAYAQMVQANNYSKSFVEFAKMTRIDYQYLYDRWNEISSKVVIKYFDKSLLVNNDIISDFLNNIELNPNYTSPKINQNYSIGGNLLFVKYILNKNKLHNKKQYNTFSKIASRKLEFHTGFCISSSDATFIRNLHKHNNEFLENNFKNVRYKDFTKRPLCPDLKCLDFRRIIYDYKFFWRIKRE